MTRFDNHLQFDLQEGNEIIQSLDGEGSMPER